MRYADRPIPVLELPPTALEYRSVPVDRADPRAAEPLVQLSDYGIAGSNYYARTDGGNPPYGRRIAGAIDALLARRSVAERLAAANARLRTLGLELYVVDAYRSPECQRGIWDFFWRKFSAAGYASPDLENQVGRYVSDPRKFDPQDEKSWPLHSTGGAIDATLRPLSASRLLEMGTHIDDASAVSQTSYFELRLASNRLSTAEEAAMRHRRVLFWHMIEAGFTNYSYEYWHYDYGNQMYALLMGQQKDVVPQAAFYPFIALEETGATVR